MSAIAHSEPVREISVEVRGMRLAARAWGSPLGRPVLALHGWMDNAASYDTIAPLLLGSGLSLQLVALDLPGHGLSEHRPPQASYEFVEWIPDVVSVLDELGWRRCTLMGHSLGGAIASCVAAAIPQQVDRLVLLDALGPLTADADEAPAVLAAAVAERRRRARRRSQVYADRGRAAERLLELNLALSAPAAELLVGRGVRDVPGGVAWRHDFRLRQRSLSRLTEKQVLALLGAVTCPVLLVRATDGWPMPLAGLQARLACLRDAQLAEVEGGHHVHLVHPDRVVPVLRAFLAD